MFFEQMYQNKRKKIVHSSYLTKSKSKKVFTSLKSYELIGASCCSKIYFCNKLLATRDCYKKKYVIVAIYYWKVFKQEEWGLYPFNMMNFISLFLFKNHLKL